MLITLTARIVRPFICTLDFLTPLSDLLVRCWIAYIFFSAGLLKVES